MSSQIEDAASADSGRRVAVLIEYDGSGLAGSQLQSNAVTVQGVLEAAILKATESAARVSFAGRTDAGVHARGQVASFVTPSMLDPETLQRALNAWLPEDVTIREVADVATDFDPRRAARRRHYRYVIDNRSARPALERGRAWHVGGRLDVTTMAEAAQRLVGQHDFAPFASRLGDEAASTVRELYCFSVNRRGGSILLDVEANAFLPHQVRRMTGALVEVGRGKSSPEEYAALLAGPPASAGPAAPPHGLYLMGIEYPEPVFCALDSEEGVC
jgi:tRNA pseudouridine38-40 synthase